jgi:hypothetical protein
LIKRRKFRNSVMLVLALFCLGILAAAAVPSAQAISKPNDILGHWAESYIDKLVSQGAVAGYPDGTYRPNQLVTRVEFMLMINKAYKVPDTDEVVNMYDVVNNRDWFAHEMAKTVTAGLMGGYPDHTFRPNAIISRQEAAYIVAKASELDLNVTYPLAFADKDSIPLWSKPSIAAMAAVGYISGYPDGTFRPFDSISRGEAAVIITRSQESKTKIYGERGTYGPSFGTLVLENDVIIASPGITFQNIMINGNLTILGSVGKGGFTMRNVEVKGLIQDYTGK